MLQNARGMGTTVSWSEMTFVRILRKELFTLSERNMRQRLVKALKPLNAVSVENAVGPGTPDINYTKGWIECKWLRSWPKKADTVVRLGHPLMPDQIAWIKRRMAHGRVVWVMLQCKQEWFLFSGLAAIHVLGSTCHKILCETTHRYWPNGLNVDELIDILDN